MSGPKRGLGRGLDALLGPAALPSPADTPRNAGSTQLRVDAIRPNPQQPRQYFDPAALAELEASIRELGVIVPVIVRPLSDGSTYELIAGERRWRASAAARLETIPAIVREADDRASLELAVVENLQRADLDPIEEAMGFQHLLQHYSFTQERLAERVGRSQPAIANAMRLLRLSDPIKAKLRSGALSLGHAKALLALDEPAREAVAERIVRDELSVRAVERLAQPRAKRTQRVAPARSPDLEALEGRLRYALGARVAIEPGAKGGRIEIRYADDGELDRLLDVLAPQA